MKIFSQMQVYQPILYPQPNINKKSRYTFQNQSYDTVVFGAMKKSDFVGIDRACIDKFKAPIEKFKTNEHLQAWAKKKLEPIMTKVYEGRDSSATEDRRLILDDWKLYLNNPKNEFKDTERLLIMSAITQPLERTNDILPPRLNKTVLANVMDRVKNGEKINLNKTYSKELREVYLKDKFSEKKGEWVIIPSKINKPEKFKENVEALKVLSNYTWCTHNNKAEQYLRDGDFHIYIENEQPKIGIRFIGDTVREIQGEKNDGNIPYKYSDIVLNHIKSKPLGATAKTELEKLKIVTKGIETAKKDLKEAIKNNDSEAIFKYLGYIENDKKPKFSNGVFSKIKNIFARFIKSSETQNVKPKELTIESYRQPGYFIETPDNLSSRITFNDLGIDENKLFKDVKQIKGDAFFGDSDLTSLYNVESIGGEANFCESKVKSLGNLKRIGGVADFSYSQIKSLGNLERIGGTTIFCNSKITSLGKIKRIGGSVRLLDSEVKDLGDLRSVGDSIYFNHTKIKSLNHLRRIEGSTSFLDSEVEDFGELEYVGGCIQGVNPKMDIPRLKRMTPNSLVFAPNLAAKRKNKMKSV